MEYIPLETTEFYKDCAPLVEGLGYYLVELKIIRSGKTLKINSVIASKDSSVDIGVDDCAKVHHALLPRLEALLGTDNTYMELTSPGMERNLKNAAEFAFFKEKEVRVWDKNISDWQSGIIKGSDDKSVILEKDGEEKTFLFENIAKAKFIHL